MTQNRKFVVITKDGKVHLGYFVGRITTVFQLANATVKDNDSVYTTTLDPIPLTEIESITEVGVNADINSPFSNMPFPINGNIANVIGVGFLIFLMPDGSRCYSERKELQINAERKLQSIDGYSVLGWNCDAQGQVYTETPVEELIIPEGELQVDNFGSVGTNGNISGVIALAKFTAPDMVLEDGNGYVTETAESGCAIIGSPTNSGLGSIEYGEEIIAEPLPTCCDTPRENIQDDMQEANTLMQR